MKACGNTPPIEIKNKDKWIMIEKNRWARNFQIPMADKAPEPFPQATLHAQRALCAISLAFPDKLDDCLAALYHTFWVERQTIGKPEVFGPVLQKVLGEADAKTVMEKMASPEVKKLLVDNTDLSIKEGAFGLPWFVATNSNGEKEGYVGVVDLNRTTTLLTENRFWGFDHLGQVIDHLGLERKEEGFRAML